MGTDEQVFGGRERSIDEQVEGNISLQFMKSSCNKV